MNDGGRATGVRARARAQMIEEILDVAREQLAEQGAGGLSLRAVAREVGMVSSAIYRYFDSRDALLTALIIDAYNSLGEKVEQAECVCERGDLAGRWRAVAGAVRSWAHDEPHLYALVYGSPVPGYAAPQDTIVPATRATRVLADIVGDCARRGSPSGGGRTTDAASRPSADVVESIAPLAEFLGSDVPPELAVHSLMAWTGIFGFVSFELFGQLHGAVEADGAGAVFAAEVDRWADWLGLG
ncbi:MAG: TetR/AcrR family transcriptional regulator [Ornithinimicrobium sp.]